MGSNVPVMSESTNETIYERNHILQVASENVFHTSKRVIFCQQKLYSNACSRSTVTVTHNI